MMSEHDICELLSSLLPSGRLNRSFESDAEVLDFDAKPTNAKVSGSRVVFRARNAKTDDWALTVNLSTFFDPSAQRLYALEVVCSPGCYDQDSSEITKIVNSWRIG